MTSQDGPADCITSATGRPEFRGPYDQGSPRGHAADGPVPCPFVAGRHAAFSVLDDVPAIYGVWKSLVGATGVIGKQVHDARLVAVCHVHKVTHLLTFNITHFAALARVPPGIVVVDPANV